MNRKKITSLIAIVLLLTIGFFGTSCCRCTSVDFEETQWRIRDDIHIRSIDWQLSVYDDERFFSATFPLPELTPFIFNYGLVVAYFMHSNTSQTMLPYSRTWIERWTEIINDEVIVFEHSFTETISADFNIRPSTVTFYFHPSDAFVGERPPPADIRIVMIW